MLTPTTNVTPGNKNDFSTNVAARDSQTGWSGAELPDAAVDLQIVERRFVGVDDRDLELDRAPSSWAATAAMPRCPSCNGWNAPEKITFGGDAPRRAD